MPLQATTAIAETCEDAGKANRLMIARGILAVLSAVVLGTKVSAHRLLAGHRQPRRNTFPTPRQNRWPISDAAAHPPGF